MRLYGKSDDAAQSAARLQASSPALSSRQPVEAAHLVCEQLLLLLELLQALHELVGDVLLLLLHLLLLRIGQQASGA